MKTIIPILLALVVGYYAVFSIVPLVFIHRLTKQVEKASRESSRKLREWVGKIPEGEDLASRWLRESNPEELFVRIMIHAAGDKKQRALLLARLQSACKIINSIDEEGWLAAFAATHISDDSEKKDFQRVWFDKLKLYQIAVEQCFSDIKAQL